MQRQDDKLSTFFLLRYLRIWLTQVQLGFSVIAASRLDLVTFVLGKILRMGFFFIFAVSLFTNTDAILGYTKGEVLVFFASMNLIDVVTQLFWFRGLTDFQRLVSRGDFDVVLTKPISPLFWAAFRMFDFFDLLTLPAAGLFLWYAISLLPTAVTAPDALLAIAAFLFSCVLAFSINLTFASLAFWTTEIENIMWSYRDMIYVARFPPEIFPTSVQFIFTYLFPILIVSIFPARALLGDVPPSLFVILASVAIGWLLMSRLIWRGGLRHYASASS